MLIEASSLTAAEIAERTGWELKPEGACRGAVCVPLPGIDIDQPIAIETFAAAMGMGVAHDADRGLWALGDRASPSVLASADVPAIELPTFDGDAFAVASLRGRKVLLIAWASW